MTAAVARLCSGRIHYAWVALFVAFTLTLGAIGVRSGASVMIVPLEHAFGWSAETISAAISHQHPAARPDRPVHHRADGDAWAEAHDPAVPDGAAGWHRPVHLHVHAVGAVPDMGTADRCRRQRGCGGYGDRRRQPLVRHASRTGDGAADLSERRRPVDFPAGARPLRAGLWLAERVHHGDADGRRADPAGFPAAGNAVGGRAGAARRGRRYRPRLRAPQTHSAWPSMDWCVACARSTSGCWQWRTRSAASPPTAL